MIELYGRLFPLTLVDFMTKPFWTLRGSVTYEQRWASAFGAILDTINKECGTLKSIDSCEHAVQLPALRESKPL